MKRLPFRVRIALLSVFISGAVLVAFGAAAWFWMYRERLDALDREIRALAYRHPGWMGGRANYERLRSVIEMVFGEERKEQMILLVKDATGQTRYISPHWPQDLNPDLLDLHLEDSPSPPQSDGGRRDSADNLRERGGLARRGPPWKADTDAGSAVGPGPGRLRGGMAPPFALSKTPRFLTVQRAEGTWRLGILGNDGDRLVLGLNLWELQDELGRMRNAFLIALPLALLVIGWGGWWIAGQAIRPLRDIARVAEGVTAHGLDQRMPLSAEDPDITQLVRVLNGMMDRLESSFHQATRFSADASHELKTPLAVMQGELENALQSATPGSAEQRVFANLLEETQRLKTITRSLLLLAEADAGQLTLTRAPLNLSAAIGELIEDIEVMAAENRIQITRDIAPDLQVRADWNLLRQAVLNLLHNALRYNEPNGWLTLTLADRKDQVELEICNAGPGVPPADQPRLFDRFFRTDVARSRHADSVGLGLSLAREIVRAHGGSLFLRDSQPGRTCFVLSLPRQQV